eukprot:scaffold285976_cov28-Tisochrysis_lutea.AAC.1
MHASAKVEKGAFLRDAFRPDFFPLLCIATDVLPPRSQRPSIAIGGSPTAPPIAIAIGAAYRGILRTPGSCRVLRRALFAAGGDN